MIKSIPESATQSFFGDALDSVRQLAEAGGAISLDKSVLAVFFGDNNQIVGLKIVNP